MSWQTSEILIRHNLIAVPKTNDSQANFASFTTVLSNISYYGYALSPEAYQQLHSISEATLISWWQEIEKALRKITGADKNIANYVVYKNFPDEVLQMSEAEYWIKQILMYWGFPNHYFTQPELERSPMMEKVNFRVLQLAQPDSLAQIFQQLLYLPNRWTEQQWQDVEYLLPQFITEIEVDRIPFKENLIQVLKACLEQKITIKISSATDVLRLAIGLSEGDISLAKPTKFRSFKRSERRYLLSLLNSSTNLKEDVLRRKNVWKKLLFALHPGDYKKQFTKVVDAHNLLFNNGKIKTFNHQLESLLAEKNPRALSLLQKRPGEFVRRLNYCLRLFEEQACQAFIAIIPQLSMIQLLKLQSYLEIINYRIYRTIAPKGNWTKLQLLPFDEEHAIDESIKDTLLSAIAMEMKSRIEPLVPAVALSEATKLIKIQTNDSDLTDYGRGTVFPIPEEVKFIRSASYWRSGKTNSNIWYDNSWNFFDQYWQPLGSCCWNYTYFGDSSAIFSGDPTNSKDAEGNACQLIDLYLDQLKKEQVRYAVWSLLCFNHLSFDVAEEVFAALQWGEDATKGELFEPSRAQLAFPVKGRNLTKYIAMLDLHHNHLVYLDANLYGSVYSAGYNLERLQTNMPAFMEYLETIPSVYDLFKHQEQQADGLPIRYSDQNWELQGESAYVFRPENKMNTFTPFSLTPLLNL